MNKSLKRLFVYTSIIIGVVVVVTPIAVLFFQDRIVQQFILQANKRVGTPVKIKGVDISIWDNFPNVSFIFHDVYVEDSYASNAPLLTATSVALYIDPIMFWRGQYTVLGVEISQGAIYLNTNKDGINNYAILRDTTDSDRRINFDLRDILLTETSVLYQDESLGQHHSLSSHTLRASVTASSWYDILVEGDITAHQIRLQSNTFLRNKRFHTKITLRYNRENDHLLIQPSTLTLSQSQFELEGEYTPDQINISCTGKSTTIQTLLSLLPETINPHMSKYKSNGDVYFNLTIKGKKNINIDPALSIQFGLRNATLFHTSYPSRITGGNLEGSFFAPSFTDLPSASMSLKKITGELDGHPFKANVGIQNFEDPYVKFNFTGDLDALSIVNFYPIKGLGSISGGIGADIFFEGQIGLLKDKANIRSMVTSGAITMKKLNFKYGAHESLVNDLNGTLFFTNNDLTLDSVKGKFENTDFEINGLFKNIVTFLLFDNQPIGIEANIKSDFIDLNQLFDISFKKNESVNYELTPLPNLYLNLNYAVKSLHYKRFRPTQLSGNLLIKDQVCVLRNVIFNAIGGSLSFNGVIDGKNTKAIELMGSFKLNGIHIDSVFYVFENFQQDFIKDKHLKGRVFANMDLEMILNEQLKLIPQTMFANISASLKDGELNNFTPLQQLNKYIPDKELNHLRFANMKNDILIEHGIIYIPFMEVKSNVTTIDISGTHTFDQNIDYRLVVPLRVKQKEDSDEVFEKVKEDITGKSKLFLKIKGTTSQYEITYDKEAVRQKIIAGVKKEMTELKEAFQRKGQKKKKELDLEEGDYFEWYDTTIVHN